MSLEVEWDPDKARRNARKHRVSFSEAASIFADPRAITAYDEAHSSDEDRFVSVGRSGRGRLISVAHVYCGNRIRIITARLATRREQQQYERT